MKTQLVSVMGLEKKPNPNQSAKVLIRQRIRQTEKKTQPEWRHPSNAKYTNKYKHNYIISNSPAAINSKIKAMFLMCMCHYLCPY